MKGIAPGDVIAGHRIIEEIGRGGMGRVYRAEDLALRRQVALKVIAPAFAESREYRERFLREARHAASLQHRNILPIFSLGEEDGVLYATTPLIERGDLRQEIARRGPLGEGATAMLLASVAAALQAAHESGLVHRDVKPQNILLGEGDSVYLADFGLTHEAQTRESLASTGTVLGTVDFMAPELARGESSGVAADIYALGCVAFFCLTGTAPFPASSSAEAIEAHAHRKPLKVTALRPDLDPGWDRLIAKALAKEPGARFADAKEFMAAIPAAAVPDTAEVAVTKRPKRGRAVRLAGVVAAAILVAGTAVFALASGDDDDPPAVALKTFELPPGVETEDVLANQIRTEAAWVLAMSENGRPSLFTVDDKLRRQPLAIELLGGSGFGALAYGDRRLGVLYGRTRPGGDAWFVVKTLAKHRSGKRLVGPPVKKSAPVTIDVGPAPVSSVEVDLIFAKRNRTLVGGLEDPAEAPEMDFLYASLATHGEGDDPSAESSSLRAVAAASRASRKADDPPTFLLLEESGSRQARPAAIARGDRTLTSFTGETIVEYDARNVAAERRETVPGLRAVSSTSFADPLGRPRNFMACVTGDGESRLEFRPDIKAPAEETVPVPFCGGLAMSFVRGTGLKRPNARALVLSRDGRRLACVEVFNPEALAPRPPADFHAGEVIELSLPDPPASAGPYRVAATPSAIWVAHGTRIHRIDSKAACPGPA